MEEHSFALLLFSFVLSSSSPLASTSSLLHLLLSLSLSFSLSVCLSVCLCLSLSLSLCPSLSVSLSPSLAVYLSSLPPSLSVPLSLSLSQCRMAHGLLWLLALVAFHTPGDGSPRAAIEDMLSHGLNCTALQQLPDVWYTGPGEPPSDMQQQFAMGGRMKVRRPWAFPLFSQKKHQETLKCNYLLQVPAPSFYPPPPPPS